MHLCPGLHANAKIAIFAKNRKNRKWCKEEDKSPTRTRDFCKNCDFCDFLQESLKSQKIATLLGDLCSLPFQCCALFAILTIFAKIANLAKNRKNRRTPKS